ncbi:MAG: PIG-L deacetylase family protein [Dehalococcoidia bacterium]
MNIASSRTALAIVAHPDDAEFNAGGTVARWIDDGWRVVFVIVTRGDKGSTDPMMTADQLTEVRAEEQRVAAAYLGAVGVEFLGYEDGALEPSLAVRRDIARQIRRHRPERMIVTDPHELYSERYIQHPDHIAAAQAALAATYPARDRMTMPELLAEGLEPHAVSEVYIQTGRDPNVFVDITPVMERKKQALRLHASQIEEGFLAVMESIARDAAARSPEPRPEFVESFRVVRL